MRKFRQLTLAVVLTLTFATSSFAGIVDTPPAPSPQSTGIIETPPQSQAVPDDPIIEVVLNVLQSLLTVF